jgi:hypothetical protein
MARQEKAKAERLVLSAISLGPDGMELKNRFEEVQSARLPEIYREGITGAARPQAFGGPWAPSLRVFRYVRSEADRADLLWIHEIP